MSDQEIETIVNLNPFQQSNEKRKRLEGPNAVIGDKVSDTNNQGINKKLNHFQLCQQLHKLKDSLIQFLGSFVQDKASICEQIKEKQFGVDKDIKCQPEEQQKKSEEEAIQQKVGKNKKQTRQKKRVNKSIKQKKVEKVQRVQVVKNANKVKKVKKTKKMKKETESISSSSGRKKQRKSGKIQVKADNISDRLFSTIQSHFV